MNLRLIGGITIFALLFGLSNSILVHSAFAEEVAKKKKEIDLKKERELKKAAIEEARAKKDQQILRNQKRFNFNNG